jgi:hypothetical protein
MKYIFVTGAPGSKWSSVVRNIYYSASIDRSDSSAKRTYRDELHLGAYWDPGMEFGQNFDRLNEYNKAELEAEFDRAFTGTGVRIIKSHYFANHIDFIRRTWPECPVVLVYRSNDACLGWWVRCGHFNITYPSYDEYYKDLKHMSKEIDNQNLDLRQFLQDSKATRLKDSNQLSRRLGIRITNPKQDYDDDDIRLWYVMPKILI